MIAKSNDEPPKKRERTASVNYPYHPLSLCLEVGVAVREIGNGKAEVSKSLLASRLGISEQSADFAAKIASTKAYDIIEGKSTFTLSAAAKTYFFPTLNPEAEKKQALLHFLSSPGAFSQLIDLYDGTKPSLEIIGNVLHQQMGIPDSWKGRVAKFFIRSAEFAAAVDAGGFLRVKAQREAIQHASPPPPPAPSHHPGPPPPSHPASHGTNQTANGGSVSGVIVWTYPCEGKILRIETPDNLTREVWEKLKRYIDVLEP